MNRLVVKSRLKNFARQLRKSSTPHETILWNRLRGRRISGFRFKRQQALGDYIVDFICLERMLIIELDGAQHGFDDNRNHDKQSDVWLRARGYTVLRIANHDLMTNMDSALQTIWSALHNKI